MRSTRAKQASWLLFCHNVGPRSISDNEECGPRSNIRPGKSTGISPRMEFICLVSRVLGLEGFFRALFSPWGLRVLLTCTPGQALVVRGPGSGLRSPSRLGVPAAQSPAPSAHSHTWYVFSGAGLSGRKV